MKHLIFSMILYSILLCFNSCYAENQITIGIYSGHSNIEDTVIEEMHGFLIKEININRNLELIPWLNGDCSYCIVDYDANMCHVWDPNNNTRIIHLEITEGQFMLIACNHKSIIGFDKGSNRIVVIEPNSVIHDYYDCPILKDSTESISSFSVSNSGIAFSIVKKGNPYENGRIYYCSEQNLIEIDLGYLPFWYNDTTIGYLKNKRLYLYSTIDNNITPFFDDDISSVEISASPYWTGKIIYSQTNDCILFTTFHRSHFLGIEFVDMYSMDIECVSLSDSNSNTIIPINKYIYYFFID